jgi:hypothetical protein
MLELDRQLAAVAGRQHSLITMHDVIEAGGDRHHAHRRVATGRWELVGRGVYRLAGVPWTYEARVMAAVLTSGPGAVASHLCAARLYGIGFGTAPPEVSIPRGRTHRPDDVRVHQSTDLDRCSMHVRRGIPITDPARTLLDLARYIGPRALYRAIEQARRLELVTWSRLVHTLATHARKGRHGIRRLRLVISNGMPVEEVTDTDSELIALTILREHGVPGVVLHHRIIDSDARLVAEIDLAFPGELLGIEIDGGVHLDPEVRTKDEARDHELRRRGWTIRRIWWEVPVRRPDEFLRIVNRALAEVRTLRS